MLRPVISLSIVPFFHLWYIFSYIRAFLGSSNLIQCQTTSNSREVELFLRIYFLMLEVLDLLIQNNIGQWSSMVSIELTSFKRFRMIKIDSQIQGNTDYKDYNHK